MKNLRDVATAYLKKVFSDLHSAMIGLIVGAIVLSVGSIYLFWKNLWIYIKTTMQLPTPIWATTALVFLVLAYIYLKTKKVHSSHAPNFKFQYFTIESLKWKTKVYDHGYFDVERIAICKEHDLSLINGNIIYYCPEFLKKNCEIKIDNEDYSMLYEQAKSYIDKEVRNKK